MGQFYIRDVQTGDYYLSTKEGIPKFGPYAHAKSFLKFGQAQEHLNSARKDLEKRIVRSISIVKK